MCRIDVHAHLLILRENFKPNLIYRTRAIITRGLYTFYLLFEVYLCTVTFGLMYGQFSRAVSNQERVTVARVWYTYLSAQFFEHFKCAAT